MSALFSSVDDAKKQSSVCALRQLTVDELHRLDHIDLACLADPHAIVDAAGMPVAVVFSWRMMVAIECTHSFLKSQLDELLESSGLKDWLQSANALRSQSPAVSREERETKSREEEPVP